MDYRNVFIILCCSFSFLGQAAYNNCPLCMGEFRKKVNNKFIFFCKKGQHPVHVTCLFEKLLQNFPELTKATTTNVPKEFVCCCPFCLNKSRILIKPFIERCEHIWRKRSIKNCLENINKLPFAVFTEFYKKFPLKINELFLSLALPEKKKFLDHFPPPNRYPYFEILCLKEQAQEKSLLDRLKETADWRSLLRREDLIFLLPADEVALYVQRFPFDEQIGLLQTYGSYLPKDKLMNCIKMLFNSDETNYQKLATLLKECWGRFTLQEKKRLFCTALDKAGPYERCTILTILWDCLPTEKVRLAFFGRLYEDGSDMIKTTLLSNLWKNLPLDDRKILLIRLYDHANYFVKATLLQKFCNTIKFPSAKK